MGHDECMVEAQAVSDRNLALKLAEEELGLSKSTTQQQTDKQIKSGERKHRAKPKSLGGRKNVSRLEKGGNKKRINPTESCLILRFEIKEKRGAFVVMKDTSMVTNAGPKKSVS